LGAKILITTIGVNMDVTWKWIAYEMFVNSGTEFITICLFSVYILYRVYIRREEESRWDRIEQKLDTLK